MLSVANPKGFDALMCSPHFLTVKIQLQTLSGGYKAELTNRFIDGQVTVDADAEITRALDLTLFDPERKVSLDPNVASTTGIFIADMIKVWYIIESPDRKIKFQIPLFTGPIDAVERDEVFIKVKAMGKERLSLSNSWAAKTYKKGQRKTGVILDILKGEIGETYAYVPTSNAKLPTDTKLTREKSPWIVAKAIARTLSRNLIYDADGTAITKSKPTKKTYTFTEKNVTENPRISYDLENVINIVQVIGKKPSKNKAKIVYTAVAPPGHPLSPINLGRPGAPRYLWTVIEDPNISSKVEAKNLATSTLARGLLAGVDVQFAGIPNPRLQEFDIVGIDVNGVQAQFELKKFTIPLNAGVDSGYGYLTRQKPRANPGKGKTKAKTSAKRSR